MSGREASLRGKRASSVMAILWSIGVYSMAYLYWYGYVLRVHLVS